MTRTLRADELIGGDETLSLFGPQHSVGELTWHCRRRLLGEIHKPSDVEKESDVEEVLVL